MDVLKERLVDETDSMFHIEQCRNENSLFTLDKLLLCLAETEMRTSRFACRTSVTAIENTQPLSVNFVSGDGPTDQRCRIPCPIVVAALFEPKVSTVEDLPWSFSLPLRFGQSD